MKATKILVLLATIAITWCFKTNLADADGNILASGTLISTHKGNIPLEKLHSGDRVNAYDFVNHQNKINIIHSIENISSYSYYLINQEIKISGTDFVYIKTHGNLKIVRVGQLKPGDLLVAKERQSYPINQIKQVVKLSPMYAVALENQADNFFTNQFLVYNPKTRSPIFPRNYDYLDCNFSTGTYECYKVNFPPILIVFITLVLLILGILLIDKISNKITSHR